MEPPSRKHLVTKIRLLKRWNMLRNLLLVTRNACLFRVKNFIRFYGLHPNSKMMIIAGVAADAIIVVIVAILL
ncbi:hypothetical protein CG398_06075 [Bifidobacteriaceae bacterium NR003]|nr:hypothetical protein CG398_06075 [Bifidobacteriaceae bacterium NR003]